MGPKLLLLNRRKGEQRAAGGQYIYITARTSVQRRVKKCFFFNPHGKEGQKNETRFLPWAMPFIPNNKHILARTVAPAPSPFHGGRARGPRINWISFGTCRGGGLPSTIGRLVVVRGLSGRNERCLLYVAVHKKY